ncbi:hypothetical protein [Trichothermofontia sp.]
MTNSDDRPVVVGVASYRPLSQSPPRQQIAVHLSKKGATFRQRP